MHQETIMFTENRAKNIMAAVEEAITSFTGKPITSQLSVDVEFGSDGLFIDFAVDDAQDFVDTLHKRLRELVKSQGFYKEGATLADLIVGSMYALLLSLGGSRSDTTSFTFDNAERAAKVERHMQPVRKRIHECLRVT